MPFLRDEKSFISCLAAFITSAQVAFIRSRNVLARLNVVSQAVINTPGSGEYKHSLNSEERIFTQPTRELTRDLKSPYELRR